MGAVHPDAAAQTSAAGRTLSSLAVIDGDIFAGYGDWETNTGPIHVESVSAGTPLGAWESKVVVATEQTGIFRKLADGRIVVPHIDPQGAGVGYAERIGSVWTDRPGHISASSGQHVFDMVEFAGRLWACGSDGDDTHDYAVVWHSSDGGATWVESLRDSVSVVGSRFYFLAPVGEALWVHNGQQAHTFTWTGGAGWTQQTTPLLPTATMGGGGAPWRDGYVIPSGISPHATSVSLFFIDGSSTGTLLTESVAGWSIGDDGSLYIISTSGDLLRAASSGPLTFTPLEALAGGYSYGSLAVLPGSAAAVAGTTDSRLALIEFP